MSGLARRRRGRMLVGLIAGSAIMLLATAPAASAHAVLESSTPAAGALLASGAAPTLVSLTFDEPVEATLGGIQVIASNDSRVDLGTVSHPSGSAKRVSVAVSGRLAPGSYLVLWRVVSADSHPVHGSFPFAVGHPGPLAAAQAVGSPRLLVLALGGTRLAGYVGLLLLVGVVGFLLLCQPRLLESRSAARLWSGALVITAVASILGFAAQAAVDVGGGWSSALDPDPLRALLGTRLGHAHLLRLLLIAVLFAIHRQPATTRPTIRWVLAIGVMGAVATVAVEGHAGRSGYTTVLDAVHVAAGGVWLGGLVVLALVVLPALRREASASSETAIAHRSDAAVAAGDRAAGSLAVLDRIRVEPVSWVPVRRFSKVAAVSVALLVVSGVAQALRQVPEWGALTGTTYGRLLLAKVALVVAALAVAAVSTTVLHRRSAQALGHRRAAVLSRTVAVETALLVAVLAVTSVLVASTPAAAAYRPAQQRTVHAGPITVDVSVVTPAVHTLDLHLYAYGPDGALSDVEQITGEASRTDTAGALGPVTIALLHAGTGHFLANRLLLPRAGTWTLTLLVRVDQFDAYAATTTLIVR